MAREAHIVLIEDDVVDAEAVHRVLRRRKIRNRISVFMDGLEALSALRGTGEAPLSRPLILLLDLNMPRMNGLELLRELRADPQLEDTPVFVLTTSNDDVDRTAAERLGIDGYIVKADLDDHLPDQLTRGPLAWVLVTEVDELR